MRKKTALAVASGLPLPGYAREALRADVHPQQRTHAFHRFYGAPVGPSQPDREFSHMDNQRVAFRAAFILSETLEMFEKGLGLHLSVNIDDPAGEGESCFMEVDNPSFCETLAWHLTHGAGKGKRDLVEVVDALGDLNVVVNGFAIELGVDMRPVDQEVCASNFTKPDENGQPIIGDGTNGPVGKVLKGPNFVEPQLAIILGVDDNAKVR